MKKYYYLIVVCLLFSSCSFLTKLTKDQVEEGDGDYLLKRNWKLQQYRSDANSIFTTAADNIILNRNGYIGWSDGNNAHGSTMSVEDDAIMFSTPLGTAKGNPPRFIPRNQGVGIALSSVNNYVIDNEGRLLLRKDKDVLMIFI